MTITIAGILIAIATPYLGSFISSTRLTTQANELLTDLNTARSEAVKRASYVGVCASTGGSSCTSGGSFLNGWIVFLDADNSGTWTTGDSVIKVHGALDGGNTTVSDSSTVIFNSAGSLESGSSTITFCDSALHKSRQISVTATGRASSETGTC
ncbi:MAG: GspH/FimT family pseudopilin [Gammaproteobacteria bacterium]|nr:GspH/FimT family pseudopilin [Gammaproteobacteria bacterium]